MNAWKIIYIMAQWLVFITAYNRLLEALPVFIEINAGVRPWCLCRRCKLWNKENNLMACPSRVRSFTLPGWGQHLAALPALWLPFRLTLFVLGSCWPWWSCCGAQQKLRSVELHQTQLTWKQRYQEKTLPKGRVFSFTSLHPMMWSGISRALILQLAKH